MSRPQRTCLGCGTRRDKAALVRLVASGGHLLADHAGCAPGRGGYLCPGGDCLERLFRLKEERLRRAFRTPGRVSPEGLREQMQEAGGAAGRRTNG